MCLGIKSSGTQQEHTNERIAGLGAVIFVLGSLLRLSALGGAASSGFATYDSPVGPGFAVELVAIVILLVGLTTKSKGV